MKKKFQVNDIHAKGVAETFGRMTEEDLATLLRDREAFVDTGCPACHSTDTPHVFNHQSLDYRRCRNCEMLYISPAPTEAQHLEYVVNSTAMAFWRDNMPEEMIRSRRPMYVDRVEFVLDTLRRHEIEPKTCLEIGAGNGEFAEELSARVALDRLCLLEPQELNIDVPNLHVIRAGFDALESIEEAFDFVVAFELIEHLLEPDNFMRLIRRVLKPGAPLILSTPNERSVETRTLGRHSSNIIFDHVRLYNPAAITQMLARNGFKVLDVRTPGELDVERLKAFYEERPDWLDSSSVMKMVLGSGVEAEHAFQRFLVDNLLSSHMRVVAMVDGEWSGGQPPILSKRSVAATQGDLKPAQSSDNHFRSTPKEPRTFNEIMRPSISSAKDDYPAKMMSYILQEFASGPPGRLLDLGGGLGYHGGIAKSLGYDVVSVDREQAVSGIASILCDFAHEDIPLGDDSFDIIFSKSVIEHFYVRELPHVISEVKRLLRPGGAFIALTPDWESNQREFFQIFTHVTPYTVSSMEQMLRMYGFANVRSETVMQLPSTWRNPVMRLLADVTRHLPLPRSTNKWVRWSQERLVVGVGLKPLA